MTSELYYYNLGVSRPDMLRENARRQLIKYHDYIERAIRLMDKSTCRYTFNKDFLLKVDPGFFDAEEAYTGRQKQNKIDKRQIDRHSQTVHLPRAPDDLVLYGYVNGEEKEYKYSIKRLAFYDIEPIGIKEEAQDEAIETLFDRDTSISTTSGQNRLILKNVRKNRREEKLVFENPTPEIIRAEQITAKYNTTVLWRELKAVKILMMQPSPHHMPLLNLLQMTKYANWPEPSMIDFSPITERLKADTVESREQREFIGKALRTPDFAVLEGPPGSGKTTAIIELILQLCSDKRIMMVAPTHVAVDNILERLAKEDQDGVSMADKYGVIPVRIGHEDDVHPDVQKYCVENRVEEETRRLKRFFEGLIKKGRGLDAAQKELYEVLCDPDRERSNKVVEQMVLDCANLICGTTVGVIRSHIIEESRGTGPLFDYMIIDEASKSTFAEFLVPALYAERWIISGDVKQLSPHVDQRPIIENLSNIRPFKGERSGDKEICKQVFQAASYGKGYHGRIIALPEDSPLFDKYADQAKALMSLNKGKTIPLLMQVLDRAPETVEEMLNTMGASIVLVPENILDETADYMSPLLEANVQMPPSFVRRAEYFKKYGVRKGDDKPWEEEVSWRLSRQYELRDDRKARERYDADLMMLLPYFKGEGWDSADKREDVVWWEIDKIRRIALPSIIELLKCGFYLDRSVDSEANRIPLYAGLPRDVFEARSTMLRYQHRMHPQISEFPRMYVYNNDALQNSSAIEGRTEHGKITGGNREWGYRKYRNRMVWIDSMARGGDYNDEEKYNMLEVRNVEKELIAFIKWAKKNPNPDPEMKGVWSVAILTFYRSQEKEIIGMLRQLFNSFDKRSFSTGRVRVEVCTVDRFQGHEADIVFLSMVRQYKIGFLDNMNRMNVALTRAKFQLVILGNKRTFADCRSDFLNSLAEYVGDPIEF